MTLQLLIQKKMPWGHLDALTIEPCGRLRIFGWFTPDCPPRETPVLQINRQTQSAPLCHYNFRPDVARAMGYTRTDLGIAWDWHLVNDTPLAIEHLSVQMHGKRICHTLTDYHCRPVAYQHLLQTDQLLHRRDIYGQGPPHHQPLTEVTELCRTLSGRVLDFGCGIGALVRWMRQQGINATGIDLDRPAIREHLITEVAEHLICYDGNPPLPFDDQAFDTTVSFEVLEHVQQLEPILDELARITRHRLILSVPDITAITVGAPHGLVPWHLLEATHVNFFNPQSLQRTLAPWFTIDRLYRLGGFAVNGSAVAGSIAAICDRNHKS